MSWRRRRRAKGCKQQTPRCMWIPWGSHSTRRLIQACHSWWKTSLSCEPSRTWPMMMRSWDGWGVVWHNFSSGCMPSKSIYIYTYMVGVCLVGALHMKSKKGSETYSCIHILMWWLQWFFFGAFLYLCSGCPCRPELRNKPWRQDAQWWIKSRRMLWAMRWQMSMWRSSVASWWHWMVQRHDHRVWCVSGVWQQSGLIITFAFRSPTVHEAMTT